MFENSPLFFFSVVTGLVVFQAVACKTVCADSIRLIADPEKKSIENLVLDAGSVEIVPPKMRDDLPSAHVHGSFVHRSWSLISENRILVGASAQEDISHFDLLVPLTGQETSFEFVAVGPRGEVEKQELIVAVDDWPALLQSFHSERDLNYSFGAAFTHVQLTQSRIPIFSEDALTLKFSYQKVIFEPYWSLNASTFFTALPFDSDLSPYDPRFLGLNLRLGYRLPFVHEPWEILIFAGAYYTTMFVKDNGFGYQNESGPQLYPTVRRYFKNGDSGSVYFKYSPVEGTGGGSGNGFSSVNHEIAFGLGWNHRLRNQHFISLTVDWAQVHLVSQTIASELQCNSISSGISYNF